MNQSTSDIVGKRPVIRQLDDVVVSRIAAGEVVETPASAVKELVENSLDAGAKQITIDFANGGKSLIRVSDDGIGIERHDLTLAVARHATSKTDGSDLRHIPTFGFRGEALAALASAGRLTIISRVAGFEAATLRVSGGQLEPIKPAALRNGTVVELRDLFYVTPARLKFLRTDRAESQAIIDIVKRIAMSEPAVGFTLNDTTLPYRRRLLLNVAPERAEFAEAIRDRLLHVIGSDFVANALTVEGQRGGYRLFGLAALPTYTRATSIAQYLYVNGRSVRDRTLSGALRGAYRDLIKQGRHPSVVLFYDCEPGQVDVNVHPTKSEVRFRDAAAARSLLVSAIRDTLAKSGHRSSSTCADAVLGAMRTPPVGAKTTAIGATDDLGNCAQPMTAADGFSGLSGALSGQTLSEAEYVSPAETSPLGAARGQIHENYIIAQTQDGMVIVDQHAAHERLLYERLKRQMAETGASAQALLIPDIVEMSENDCAQLLANADDLRKFGLTIEDFGGSAIAVRETPLILGEVNSQAMLKDIVDELNEQGDSLTVAERIDAILSKVACHGSIRSGRRMQGEEMNALLREMENTPHSGQCNHGRPTYIELKLSDIERLFGRT
ncbi:MAG: DNA mismatch repair endonuclease MutL [Aestuariivita sp.]|nr:DNA mismatch repair endonuclease MutL [Aestuariivita sp.]MCY4346154.1 DNA mismatch repair endonuclease MutL [Aestuariivita sp.]